MIDFGNVQTRRSMLSKHEHRNECVKGIFGGWFNLLKDPQFSPKNVLRGIPARKYCPTQSKNKYPNEATAMKFGKIIERKTQGSKFRAYKCRCGFFHITNDGHKPYMQP